MTIWKNRIRKLVHKGKKLVARVTAMVLAAAMLLSLCPAPAMAFTYRDNCIEFKNYDTRYEILDGRFEIQEMSISEGQDPDGNYSVGKTVPLENRDYGWMYLNFRVGRHGTEDVASAWNKRFNDENAIRGDSDKLNFYFFGVLYLTVKNRKTGEIYEMNFQHIGMSQEGYNGSNIWHFGQTFGAAGDDYRLTTYGAANQENCGWMVTMNYSLDCDEYTYSSYRFEINSIKF